MSTRSVLSLLAVCAVVALLAYGLLSKGTSRIQVGDRVPDKALPYLSGGRGMGTIADHRGEWVLVNLWASWCVPCHEEAPVLNEFSDRFRKQDVTVLGINVEDNEADARKFIDKYQPPYPILGSRGAERSEAFGANGVPENFLVDPRGIVAAVVVGPVDEEILENEVIPVIEGKA